MPKALKSSLKSSRSSTPSVSKTKDVQFKKLARTLSSNPQEVLAADIENHHKQNPRLSKSHYRPVFKFKTRYTTDLMGDNPTNKEVAWQSPEEYANAKKEKQQEYINAGYSWSVNAVSDDFQTVKVCDLKTETCEIVSTSYFDGIPIVGEIYKKIRYILGKGGKRTQKKRRTNKKRKN